MACICQSEDLLVFDVPTWMNTFDDLPSEVQLIMDIACQIIEWPISMFHKSINQKKKMFNLLDPRWTEVSNIPIEIQCASLAV